MKSGLWALGIVALSLGYRLVDYFFTVTVSYDTISEKMKEVLGMEKLVVAGLIGFLATACVSKPAPWRPDGAGGRGDDSGAANADGRSELSVGDASGLDAPWLDVIDAGLNGADDADVFLQDQEDATTSVDLLDSVDIAPGEVETVADASDTESDVADVDVQLEDVAAETSDACSPACDGLECGADGCGGSCGECGGTQDACIDGFCVCQPDCDQKECGDDGCDGSCGECNGGMSCLAGACVPSCGDGDIVEGEECDDGNVVDWDGCTGCAASEFQVNQTWEGAQSNPKVAGLMNGGFALVWTQSNLVNGSSVRLRCFAADGSPSTEEKEVPTDIGASVGSPGLTNLEPSGFVAVWSETSTDEKHIWLKGQLFNENCDKSGSAFVIAETKVHYYPELARLPGGGFVVVWSVGNVGEGILAQTVDGVGNPLLQPIQVSEEWGTKQVHPAVTSFADGSFLVLWEIEQNDDIDLYARRFGANGQALGSSFKVNTPDVGNAAHPKIVALIDGSSVGVWNGEVGDGSGSVFAQRFLPQGTVDGERIEVDTWTEGAPSLPTLAPTGDGGIVVFWEGTKPGDSVSRVYGQLVDATNNKVGGEFMPPLYAASSQNRPRTAALTNDRFMVAWAGNGQDGDGMGIFARIYATDGSPLPPCNCPGPNLWCDGGDCQCVGQQCGSECCSAAGFCVDEKCCAPDCTGRECGDDGCGGTCGSCGVSESCTDGICGDPLLVGCSDGQRDGFKDSGAFPSIASCAGVWIGENLRAEATGSVCGDDAPGSPECPVPADLCASGWHVCLKDGLVGEITSKIDADHCNSFWAGPGAFVAASSHCQGGCNYPVPLQCYPFSLELGCDNPVACGGSGTTQGQCKDTLWPGESYMAGLGCSSGEQGAVLGVMCCKDE